MKIENPKDIRRLRRKRKYEDNSKRRLHREFLEDPKMEPYDRNKRHELNRISKDEDLD